MDIESLKEKKENLIRRARLFRSIRECFDGDGFLEVETDVRIPAPAPEEFIESITAEGQFLRCSPEIAMKIMLGAGYGRIYQIGRCFRANEHGRKHREEFTMLEYYAAGMDYRELADWTCGMIRRAALDVFGAPSLTFRGEGIDLAGPPEIMTVDEAFRKYAGCSMAEAHADDTFDEKMVLRIEPELGRGRVTVLTDYPAERASLARLKPEDRSVAERWELYISGIELANAYGELIDPVEQRRRFRQAAEFRRMHRMHEYPEPEDFFAALGSMGAASGAALGLDRLAMIFCDADDIAQVRAE